jgi:hypothetical protein
MMVMCSHGHMIRSQYAQMKKKKKRKRNLKAHAILSMKSATSIELNCDSLYMVETRWSYVCTVRVLGHNVLKLKKKVNP